MLDEDETLVHVTQNAPWLPLSGRAEVVRRGTPPRPMSVVRLLLRDAGRVFCVPCVDANGRLDLPMRVADATDRDGGIAIRALAESVIGEGLSVRFVGAVRNVVHSASDYYVWPTPFAHFGVWAADGVPLVGGTWVDVTDGVSPLRDRHWYRLL